MKPIITLLFVVTTYVASAQIAPFEIYIEPFNIPNLGGLQSYAYGQSENKWLVIGGRLDGLHRRQPFAAFDVAGNNNQIMVIDPINENVWSASISSLPLEIQEQMSSTNMEYYQEGNILYLLGGYGYDNASNSKMTFPYMTAVNVSELINAIVNSEDITGYFRQISDEKFAVTGGHLEKINSTFYLVGGNRFDGNYNPMGNPTYTQVYTDAIRKFDISDDGSSISISHYPEIIDSEYLHRRDYNAVPQILPNGEQGITAFSGVFQPDINVPFLHSVNIDESGFMLNENFTQYYNHYHCPVLPMYSEQTNEMHNVFFGGIAQYYEENGNVIQDDNIPFVKTIARVSRDASGQMTEYKLPIEMPDFLGAGSDFILLNDVPHFQNNVIQLDQLAEDSTLVGFIYGGIASTDKNIFFTNTGTQSEASNIIFKVYVIKVSISAIDELNEESNNSLSVQIFPNPSAEGINLNFHLKESSEVELFIHSSDGKLVYHQKFNQFPSGKNTLSPPNIPQLPSDTYTITLQTKTQRSVQKLITQD